MTAIMRAWPRPFSWGRVPIPIGMTVRFGRGLFLKQESLGMPSNFNIGFVSGGPFLKQESLRMPSNFNVGFVSGGPCLGRAD